MRSYLLPSPDLPPTDVPLYRPGGVTVGGGGPQVFVPRDTRPSVTVSPGSGGTATTAFPWGGGVYRPPANWTNYGTLSDNPDPGAGPTAIPDYWGPSNGTSGQWRDGGAAAALLGRSGGGGGGNAFAGAYNGQSGIFDVSGAGGITIGSLGAGVKRFTAPLRKH